MKKPMWAILLFLPFLFSNWTSSIRNTLNVKDFGAIGNGVSDDTDSIIRAFAVLDSLGGGTLFFPAGIFLVDPSNNRRLEVVPDNVKVRGLARQSIIKLKDQSIGFDRSNFRLETLMLGNKNPDQGNRRISIKNLIFDANYRGNREAIDYHGGQTAALFFSKVSDFEFDNCVLMDTGQDGLVLKGGENSDVSRNYFFSIAQGPHQGVALQSRGSFRTEVKYNRFENVSSGIFCGQEGLQADSIVLIKYNTLHNLLASESPAVHEKIDLHYLQRLQLDLPLNNTLTGVAKGPAISIASQQVKVGYNSLIRQNEMLLSGVEKQPVSDIQIYKNNIKGKSFISNQQKAGIVIEAGGQPIQNIDIRKNEIHSPLSSGILVQSDLESKGRTPKKRSTIENLNIQDNIIFSGRSLDLNSNPDTFPSDTLAPLSQDVPFFDATIAGIYFQSNATATTIFKNIAIHDNQLSYEHSLGLAVEGVTEGFRFYKNELLGAPDRQLHFAPGVCIELYQKNTAINQELKIARQGPICHLSPTGIFDNDCQDCPVDTTNIQDCEPCLDAEGKDWRCLECKQKSHD